ncbi:Eukaryotic translation initiation factor 3 subunit J [Acropora cervicornis]|uniref:Eukaryotic translation initiation factor 3 subunit J n=1 Tax=Acropora cervicornis TaxID=6130 RepID=A0AAD9V816_ACRCE|nr:Eukaryotic translation initiation factor 3 subunit J [Acropora cervicornis]
MFDQPCFFSFAFQTFTADQILHQDPAELLFYYAPSLLINILVFMHIALHCGPSSSGREICVFNYPISLSARFIKMADWDDEEFEPQDFGVKQSDKWEGEDEDDNDVKENWDDEDEDDTKEKPEKTENETDQAPPQEKVKKRRTLKQVLKEKEEKANKEALLTEQEKQLQKEMLWITLLSLCILVEKSDLELAKQAFGVQDVSESKSIDGMNPSTKEDFEELSKLIVGKLSNYQSSAEYLPFLETLFRDLCVSLDAEEIKRLGSAINILSTEKLKATQKTKKSKKATKKVTLAGSSAKAGRRDNFDAFGGGNYDYGDEFDDFM